MTASCGHRRPRVAANPHQCSAYGMAVGQCLHDVSRISRSPGFFSSLLAMLPLDPRGPLEFVQIDGRNVSGSNPVWLANRDGLIFRGLQQNLWVVSDSGS